MTKQRYHDIWMLQKLWCWRMCWGLKSMYKYGWFKRETDTVTVCVWIYTKEYILYNGVQRSQSSFENALFFSKTTFYKNDIYFNLNGNLNWKKNLILCVTWWSRYPGLLENDPKSNVWLNGKTSDHLYKEVHMVNVSNLIIWLVT